MLCAVAAPLCRAALPYDSISAKADRFYAHKEWRSASAMYELMLDERPAVASTYAYALTAAGAVGDTVAQSRITRLALRHGVPVDSVFVGVGNASVALGEPQIFVRYVNSVAASEPWLKRAACASLLRYYVWRRNGPETVKYALLMLDGLPDDVGFLRCLAQGYLDSGNLAGAEGVYNRILEVDPDDYDSLLYLGNAALQRGDKKAGAEYLRRAYSVKQTPYVESLLVRLQGRR